ncbi:MAG: MATE family efflux transporter, partial [Syntrophomonadaceae bacterium]|nr:MATE family efflux transporter [Syntrophomonadaceae bacterium]
MSIFNRNRDNTKTVKPSVAERTEMIGTEDVGKLLRHFALPAIVAMLANASYVIINRIFVGHAVGGTTGIAAITICFPIMIIFMSLSMLIGVGATTLISIRLGQQKSNEAEVIMGNALSLLFFLPLLCCLGMYFYIEPLLLFFGATESVLPYAVEYLKIMMPAMIIMSVSMGMNNVIRAEGSPVVAMLSQVLGGAVNVCFNYLFVMRLGFGMQGAALGAVLGQTFSCIWVMSYFLSPSRSYLKIRAANLLPRMKYVPSIMIIGFAPFAMQVTASVQNLILNRTLSLQGGDVALAAVGIIGSLAPILVMPIVGFGQGAQPIIGYNYGARQYDRVRMALKKATIYASIFAVCGWIVIQMFPGALVSIFTNNEPETVALATYAIVIFFAMLPVVGFQIVCAGYFQAIGKPVQATILSLARQILLFIPLLLILPRFMGLDGVWISAPVSDVAAAMITAGWIFAELRRTGMLTAKAATAKTQAARA